ncbi:MAG: lipid-binding SYLF domain-containing protein, partial [Pyramidobacter sp.]|nr:lipid-binding SYLF domain-containing protein [Pyramidobacter sp.]
MKKLCALILLITLLAGGAAFAKDHHVTGRVRDAQKAVERMIGSKYSEGFAQSVRESLAVVIFPNVVKAGLIVGGRYGEGLILRKDPKTGTWNGPAFFSISGGSYGLQLGASSTALVLTVNTKRALDAFRGGSFTLGAEVTAAAGPGGNSSYVGTTVDGKAPIYSYSLTKGVFAGVALDGSVISELPAVNDECWG